jgi:hypothetical protein
MKRSSPVESERQQTRNPAAVAAISSVHQVFADNRESTANQRQLMAAMANSPQAIAQRKISQLIHNSPRMLAQRKMLSGEAVQRVEEEDPLQGKFTLLQRVEEEELLQGKFEAAQRIEEEEPLQGKFAVETPAQLEQQSSAKPNNTGLPDNLKSGIENLSGMSMDSVRVHYNSAQPAQLNALAYAQGTDIHVAPGQEQHLPHEAWHVVQQAQGRVQPTMQMKDGVPVNDDRGLEHEADVMGAKALQMGGGNQPSIQRKCDGCSEIEGDMQSSPAQRKVSVSYRPLPVVAQTKIIQRACYFFKNSDCQGKKVYATSKHNFRDYASYNCSGERGGADCVENDGKGHCAC